MRKKVTKVKGTLNKEKGLVFEKKEYNVLAENDKALVIDSELYETIYKGERDSDYKDYVNEAREVTTYVTGDLITVTGYFDAEAKGENIVKEKINEYLVKQEAELNKYKNYIK